MPQLNLYQTEMDELEVVRCALNDGCWIVPDSNYETPRTRVLKTVKDFQRSRMTERHFYILHEHFVRMPLHLRPISKDGKTMYYISSSQGGPFLEFMGGGIIQDNETLIRKIRPGFLAYSSSFWDSNITKMEASPPELAETYKRIAKAIRKVSTRIKPDQSVYWLGPDAQTHLQGGVKLGLHSDWSPPVR